MLNYQGLCLLSTDPRIYATYWGDINVDLPCIVWEAQRHPEPPKEAKPGQIIIVSADKAREIRTGNKTIAVPKTEAKKPVSKSRAVPPKRPADGGVKDPQPTEMKQEVDEAGQSRSTQWQAEGFYHVIRFHLPDNDRDTVDDPHGYLQSLFYTYLESFHHTNIEKQYTPLLERPQSHDLSLVEAAIV